MPLIAEYAHPPANGLRLGRTEPNMPWEPVDSLRTSHLSRSAKEKKNVADRFVDRTAVGSGPCLATQSKLGLPSQRRTGRRSVSCNRVSVVGTNLGQPGAEWGSVRKIFLAARALPQRAGERKLRRWAEESRANEAMTKAERRQWRKSCLLHADAIVATVTTATHLARRGRRRPEPFQQQFLHL